MNREIVEAGSLASGALLARFLASRNEIFIRLINAIAAERYVEILLDGFLLSIAPVPII